MSSGGCVGLKSSFVWSLEDLQHHTCNQNEHQCLNWFVGSVELTSHVTRMRNELCSHRYPSAVPLAVDWQLHFLAVAGAFS